MQSALHILELPSPFDVVARWKRNLFPNFLLQFGDETAKIAIFHIDADDNPALAHVTIDLRRPFVHLDIREVLQRDLDATRRVEKYLPDFLHAIALIFRQAHDRLEAPLAFVDL